MWGPARNRPALGIGEVMSNWGWSVSNRSSNSPLFAGETRTAAVPENSSSLGAGRGEPQPPPESDNVKAKGRTFLRVTSPHKAWIGLNAELIPGQERPTENFTPSSPFESGEALH